MRHKLIGRNGDKIQSQYSNRIIYRLRYDDDDDSAGRIELNIQEPTPCYRIHICVVVCTQPRRIPLTIKLDPPNWVAIFSKNFRQDTLLFASCPPGVVVFALFTLGSAGGGIGCPSSPPFSSSKSRLFPCWDFARKGFLYEFSEKARLSLLLPRNRPSSGSVSPWVLAWNGFIVPEIDSCRRSCCFSSCLRWFHNFSSDGVISYPIPQINDSNTASWAILKNTRGHVTHNLH